MGQSMYKDGSDLRPAHFWVDAEPAERREREIIEPFFWASGALIASKTT